MNGKPINRRSFLRLAALGGVAAAGGYVLSEYTPWLDYDGQAQRTWVSGAAPSDQDARLRALVHAATLAANGHNTQPWKFRIQDNAIEIYPDLTRRLPVLDPADREMWISLGCALENMVIAAAASGLAAQVTYHEASEYIRVEFSDDTPKTTPLFEAIPNRQNTRSIYSGQAVPPADLDQVMALPAEPGITLRYFTTPAGLETVVEYVNQGNLSQYADPAFLDELVSWLRFNKKEALSSMDGLYTRCSGNPEVPRWLGTMFVTGGTPQQQADLDAQKLRSSAGAVVIAAETDDKTAWVRAGQAYERLALKLASLNLKSAFHNQPIEIPEIRRQFQQAVGLGGAAPQLLLRYGTAPASPRSLRRLLSAVLA